MTSQYDKNRILKRDFAEDHMKPLNTSADSTETTVTNSNQQV